LPSAPSRSQVRENSFVSEASALIDPLSRRAVVAGLSVSPVLLAYQAAAQAPAGSEDARFLALGARWLDGSMRLGPVNATQVGDHRFDAMLDDLSPAGRKAQTDFDRRFLAELAKIDRRKLSRANQVDAAMLENALRYDLWGVETLQGWAWDPMPYNSLAGGALYGLMARDFAPLPQRLSAAAKRMKLLPRLFAQMRANLVLARVPKIHAETVTGQNKGLVTLIDTQIAPEAAKLSGAARAELEAAIGAAKSAIAEHQVWLEKTLVPNAKGDFRLGAKLYDEKLAFALMSPLSRAEIRRLAEESITRTRAEMYGLALKALGRPAAAAAPSAEEEQKTITEALEIANRQHASRDGLVAAAEASLAQATAFVRDKRLVSLPSAPVKIILMPEFQQGVSVAYCDSPGVLDKGQSTFYAVSPIPRDWTAEQTESFLREYNSRVIHELTIHEAMPGHYLQLAHSNAYPSAVRGVLQSGSFIEGWGMYAEDIMADAGYLDRDPLFLLVHLKWRLRATANAILDQATHVDGMSREAAMKLMTERTFQEEREAAGKWTRVSVTSAQLPTYFVGYSEHVALRREAERRAGGAFDLMAYHDKAISFGSPPVRYVRALMFEEAIA
jgi:uncharacterized protein (DUF885 family)